MVTTDKANVADGDRLWDSHHAYMRSSRQDFLITYALAKGPEQSNPLDPASAATGRTAYALDECHRTGADIGKHWKKAAAEWLTVGRAGSGAPVSVAVSADTGRDHGRSYFSLRTFP